MSRQLEIKKRYAKSRLPQILPSFALTATQLKSFHINDCPRCPSFSYSLLL